MLGIQDANAKFHCSVAPNDEPKEDDLIVIIPDSHDDCSEHYIVKSCTDRNSHGRACVHVTMIDFFLFEALEVAYEYPGILNTVHGFRESEVSFEGVLTNRDFKKS